MKEVNIISFDVPYPPNYGGVIDVFYKIKYLSLSGIKVHLHCFEYGRGMPKELDKYCETVNYYKRKTGLASFFSKIPYIIKSRTNENLKQNLLKNDFPIIFEGLHSCRLIDEPLLKDRMKIFRESNVEHEYYRHLAKAEKNILKKIFFHIEAIKLKNYEKIIKNADISFIVSLKDLEHFQKNYPQSKFVHLPSFHPNDKLEIKEGRGNYVLYHGNLSVPENNNAAVFIIKNIFNDIDIPLIIAGMNPKNELKNLVKERDNITLIENPGDKEMNDLIQNAQINFLYTDQATGLKLKLLKALYIGRHCIVNSKMVQGTSLSEVCIVKDSIKEIKSAVADTFTISVSEKSIDYRRMKLEKTYCNEKSLQTLLKESL